MYMVGVNYFLFKCILLYVDVGIVCNGIGVSYQLENGGNLGVLGLKQIGGYFGIVYLF